MSLGDETHSREHPEEEGVPEPRRSRGPADMGNALRSVYRETVEEAVPDEMLDLRGKLD